MLNKAKPKRDLRNDIEILRAISVLLVITSHLKISIFKTGFIGVDIFFAISGYLIGKNLIEKTLSIKDFYNRRIKRIAPLAIIVITLTTILSSLYLPKSINIHLTKDSIYSLFSLINYELYMRTTNYFAKTDATSIFQHFWSLAIEEQFYLIAPFIILVAFKRLRNRVKIALMLALSISSLLFFAINLENSPAKSYFNTYARVWELSLGVTLALIGKTVNSKYNIFIQPLLILSLVILATIKFNNQVILYLLVSLITLLVLALKTEYSKFAKPLIYTGAISYGLYLWHWPIIILLSKGVETLSLFSKTLILVITFSLASLTKYFVEDPVRKTTISLNKTIVYLILAILTSLSLIKLSSIIDPKIDVIEKVNLGEKINSIAKNPKKINNSSDEKSNTKEQDKGMSQTNQEGDSVKEIINNNGEKIEGSQTKATTAPIKENDPNKKTSTGEIYQKFDPYVDIYQPVKDLASLQKEIEKSSDKNYKVTQVKQDLANLREDIGFESRGDCPVPNSSCTKYIKGGKEVYLLGDSHGTMWYSALSRVEDGNKYRVTAMTLGGCPIIEMTYDEYKNPTSSKEKYLQCQKSIKEYIKEIKNDKPDVVLLTSATQTGKADWILRYPNLINDLKPYTKKIIFIGDFIYASENMAECVQLNIKKDIARCGQSVATLDPMYRKRVELEKEVVSKTKVQYFEPMKIMCSKTYCPAVISNVIIYRDRFHLTKTFGRYVGNVFLKELNLI